ncbi:MAG TPA: anthranilate synthase component I, partial [Gammaproteobacteria bacterium]|nr:anthranilate synthase component I [Gammaproteobacteria bacterium]
MSSEKSSTESFSSLSQQGYNRVPLVREVLADLDTPLSTYLKLADAPYSYLFESVQGGEKWGRYSIIGLPCKTVIKISGHSLRLYENGRLLEEQTVDDPLAWVSEYQSRFRVYEDGSLPRFTGGLVGYFGYETIAYIEKRLAGRDKPDPLETPDILLMLSEEVVVFDNLSGKLYIIVHVDPSQSGAREAGENRLAQIASDMRNKLPDTAGHQKQM